MVSRKRRRLIGTSFTFLTEFHPASLSIYNNCPSSTLVHHPPLPKRNLVLPILSQQIPMASADVEFRCFVGGLAWATDDHSLERAFSHYGDVLDSKIINDRETGRSRGFGFVTFSNEQAMKDAIEGMNGQNLDGRNITVNEAQSRGSGGGGFRSGNGGGGYGGGRREGGGGGYNRGYGGGGGYGGGRREGGYGGGDRYARGDSDGQWMN